MYVIMFCIKCWVEFDSQYRHCQQCYDNFINSNPRDYTLLVNIDTPKDVRRKMDIWDTYMNQIKCNKCWEVIRSKNRHDFVMCKCGNCWVDWGSWYWRTIWDDYIDMRIAFSDVTD